MKLYGAVEAGGTKFVCAIGTGPDDAMVSRPIPTREPEETLAEAIGFFAGRKIKRLGVGSFGPLDLKRGAISKTTPKLAWRGVPIRSILERALDVEVRVDTDVNAAALGEHRWGAARGVDDFVYLTVGTGIGGGAMVNGRLVHGLSHPEMGHQRTPGEWRGVCPSHENCLEGYACGPAIEELGGDRTAEYLATCVINLACILSPRLVILGGGVMKTPGLLDRVRARLREETYIPLPRVVRPKLGDRAGVLGALALAQMKLRADLSRDHALGRSVRGVK